MFDLQAVASETVVIHFKEFLPLGRDLTVGAEDLLRHFVIHIQVIAIVGFSVDKLVAILPFTARAKALTVALAFAFFLAFALGAVGFAGMIDALLATVQMPAGIPVATVAIDGAENAAILAVQMLALSEPVLAEKLNAMKEDMAKKVLEKDAALAAQIAQL